MKPAPMQRRSKSAQKSGLAKSSVAPSAVNFPTALGTFRKRSAGKKPSRETMRSTGDNVCFCVGIIFRLSLDRSRIYPSVLTMLACGFFSRSAPRMRKPPPTKRARFFR